MLINTKGLEHETGAQTLLTTDVDHGHENISDDGHQQDSGTTILDDSFENTVNQIGEPQEKAPDTEIPWTPPHANTEPQEHQFLSPESETVFSGELESSQTYVKNEEDNFDHASTESSNQKTWENVVVMLEESQEIELLGLREDMEALEAKHQEEIRAANSKKLVLQKRVKKLVEQKAALENDLKAKDATIERALAASQSSSFANDLRKENIRLSDLVASLGSKNKELNEILQHRHIQNLEAQLAHSVDSHLRNIEGKDSVIANLQAKIDYSSRQIDALVRPTNDKGLQHLVRSKNHEMASLNADLSNLRAENWALQQNERAREEEGEFTAVAAIYSEIESNGLKIRLREAEEELTKLRSKAPESEISEPGSHAAGVIHGDAC